MSKAIMICGKICSGKSTYAENLRIKEKAVILSCDEITLALFGQHAGENHDLYVERAKSYLFRKSLEILEIDIDVILDWGFWTREERDRAKEFYNSHDINFELHYIDVSDRAWKANIKKRNSDIQSGKALAYCIDEPLAAKFNSIFEVPEKDEIDVWVV